MDTHLAMNVAKSSSFKINDLLDLQDSKDACSPVPTDGSTIHHSPGLSLVGSVPDVADVTSNPVNRYYDADNPYTRWLHNNENMQYSSR